MNRVEELLANVDDAQTRAELRALLGKKQKRIKVKNYSGVKRVYIPTQWPDWVSNHNNKAVNRIFRRQTVRYLNSVRWLL